MYEESFESRDDLAKYGDNSLLLYALQLRFGIEDIDSVASDALTDGANDKKADLVYVNSDEGYAVIAQGYMCRDTAKKKAAPANKASDLNTAVTWLLSQDEKNLPEEIKSAALQLRKAILDNEIEKIELWYVHNLNESKNCTEEIKAAQNSTDAIIKRCFPESRITIQSFEVGNKTLDEWYQTIKTPILVDDNFSFDVTGGYLMTTPKWECFSTPFSCEILYNLFKKYEKKLFSANIRDYLGNKRSDSNINYGIKKTLDSEPDNFWIYNNGITVITNNFNYDKDNETLIVKGFSIVNGAQTTGSIGSKKPKKGSFLPARFVKCNSPDVIANIVRFNNSQNKITAADFRSNDRIQIRLREEFKSIQNTEYTGGRRGGSADAIKRNPYLLPSDSVAQTLAAFHDAPSISYNKKSEIWNSDKLYSSFFTDKTTAVHICFVYSLFLMIKDTKNELIEKQRKGIQLMGLEADRLSFLRLRGATYLFMTSISDCMEILISKPISDKFAIHFKNKLSPNILKNKWKPIVDSLLAFSNQLAKPTESSLKNENEINNSIQSFTSLVQATKSANKKIYDDFANEIVLD